MKKETSTVKNPLTVISIFAGLAEVAGTVVLPFVAEVNQLTYIWFLMLFPVLLVLLFFATLNFNPRVLYAPSDFEDEKNYMDLFRPSSTVERLEKLEDEISQEESMDKEDRKPDECGREPIEVVSTKERLISLMQRDVRSRYMMAENLIIDRLASEFKRPAKRDIALRNRFGSQLFDAVFEDRNELVLVEIKVFSERTYPRRMREVFDRIQSSLASLPEDARKNARFLLAVAYEMEDSKAKKIENELNTMLMDFPMNTEVRMFSLNDLIANVHKK